MRKGYVIIVRNYIAEICEFETLQIINTPDGTVLYHVVTKYGEDYFKEGDLKPIRKMLEQECEEMNRALQGVKNAKRSNKNH